MAPRAHEVVPAPAVELDGTIRTNLVIVRPAVHEDATALAA